MIKLQTLSGHVDGALAYFLLFGLLRLPRRPDRIQQGGTMDNGLVKLLTVFH